MSSQNTNPVVVKFCNEQLRPLCDQFARGYRQSKIALAYFQSYGIPALLANDPSVQIVDNSPTDGRNGPPTGWDVFSLIGMAQMIVGLAEGPTNCPSPIITQAFPANTPSGTLPVNTTQWYQVTALNVNGETTPSEEVFVAVASGYNAAELVWTPMVPASGYNVYRGIQSGAENVFVGTTQNPFFVDNGGFLASGSPPRHNTALTANPGYVEIVRLAVNPD